MTKVYPSEKLRKRYVDTHWGLSAKRVRDIDDSRLPAELCAMGKLLGFILKDHEGESELNFTAKSDCTLTFDLKKSQTLYCILGKSAQRELKQMYKEIDELVMPLGRLSKEVGGRQAGFHCPSVQVKPLGEIYQVYYKTNKKGDGMSTYVHTFAEEGGTFPFLAVAADGTLWLAGGSYTVPDGGITN